MTVRPPPLEAYAIHMPWTVMRSRAELIEDCDRAEWVALVIVLEEMTREAAFMDGDE